MKNFIIALTALLVLLLCACSDSNRTKLRIICETTDKELPTDLGIGVFESMTYNEDENCVELKIMLNESVISISDLRKASQQQRDYLQSFMCQKENSELLKLLSETGSSVRLIMEGAQTKGTAEVTLSADELAGLETTENEEENYNEQLDRIIAASNAQCPSDLGDGLTMQTVTIDSGYICYNFIYDPVRISFEDAESQEAWDNLFASLSDQAGTPGLSHTFDILKKLQYGIKYRYKPEDGSIPEKIITFEPADVARM